MGKTCLRWEEQGKKEHSSSYESGKEGVGLS